MQSKMQIKKKHMFLQKAKLERTHAERSNQGFVTVGWESETGVDFVRGAVLRRTGSGVCITNRNVFVSHKQF